MKQNTVITQQFRSARTDIGSCISCLVYLVQTTVCGPDKSRRQEVGVAARTSLIHACGIFFPIGFLMIPVVVVVDTT